MRIWKKLLLAKRNASGGIRRALGREPAEETAAIRGEILDGVGSGIAANEKTKGFPFIRVIVRLRPVTELQRSSFEDAFLRDESLKRGIRQRLRGLGIPRPDAIEIVVEMREETGAGRTPGGPGSPFEIECVPAGTTRRREAPGAVITVTQGAAERPVFRLRKEHILVGRCAEVLDREGRLVRKNDVVFLEQDEEIEVSVANAHARIRYDHERSEFRVIDELSRYGTRVLRGGRLIEVPGGDPEGVVLEPGDEIFFGQAAVRFERCQE